MAVTGLRLPWLNFFVAGAILLKHASNRQNCDAKRGFDMSVLKEVGFLRFQFAFLKEAVGCCRQTPFFEASLAEKFVFLLSIVCLKKVSVSRWFHLRVGQSFSQEGNWLLNVSRFVSYLLS